MKQVTKRRQSFFKTRTFAGVRFISVLLRLLANLSFMSNYTFFGSHVPTELVGTVCLEHILNAAFWF